MASALTTMERFFVLPSFGSCFGFTHGRKSSPADLATERARVASVGTVSSKRRSRSASLDSRTSSTAQRQHHERMARRVSSSGHRESNGSRSRRSWVREAAIGTPVSPKTFTKRKSFITNDRLVRVLKRDSTVRQRFESFAERQYAAENVSFLKHVLEWKSSGYEMEQARDILELFIQDNAPRQVNISYHARTTIERHFDEAFLRARADQQPASLPPNTFEQAVREVSNMMVEGGIWGSFVWKGGCDLEGEESDELTPAPAPPRNSSSAAATVDLILL